MIATIDPATLMQSPSLRSASRHTDTLAYNLPFLSAGRHEFGATRSLSSIAQGDDPDLRLPPMASLQQYRGSIGLLPSLGASQPSTSPTSSLAHSPELSLTAPSRIVNTSRANVNEQNAAITLSSASSSTAMLPNLASGVMNISPNIQPRSMPVRNGTASSSTGLGGTSGGLVQRGVAEQLPAIAPARAVTVDGSDTSRGDQNGAAGAAGSLVGRKRKKKYSRSRAGCLTCRQRKVRCDERKPVCEKCTDLERVCVWPPTPDAPRKRRASKKSSSTAEAAGGSNDGDDDGEDEDDDGEEDEAPKASDTNLPNIATHNQFAPFSMSSVTHSATDRHDTIADWFSNNTTFQAAPSDRRTIGLPGNGHVGNMQPTENVQRQRSASTTQAEMMHMQQARPITLQQQNRQHSQYNPMLSVPHIFHGPGHEFLSAPANGPSPSDMVNQSFFDQTDQTPTLLSPGQLLNGASSKSTNGNANPVNTGMAYMQPFGSGGMNMDSNDLSFDMFKSSDHNAMAPSGSAQTQSMPQNIVQVMNMTPTARQGVAAPAPNIVAVEAPANLSLGRSALVRRRNATRTPPDTSNNNGMVCFSNGFSMPQQTMPDPFFHAFPLASHRRLFHHFLNNTSSIVVALGLRDRNKNPFLAVSLPMISLDNENPARAALRMSVLSLGAAHLHHVHRSAAALATTDAEKNPASKGAAAAQIASSLAQAKEMMQEARKTKKQAFGQMMLSLSKDGDQHLDILLATCNTLKTRDVLLGDLAWKDNLDFGMRLIYKQGGPAALIAADPGNFVRRFFVELLATTDVFSTFSTGQEPMLLGPWAPWWFDCEKYNQTSQQWEAYERQYGICRGMTEIIARCRACAYRTYASCLEAEAEAEADNEPMMGGIEEALKGEATSLINELNIWAFSQHDVPRQTRVSYGDSAYRYAMQVMLYTEVLGKPAADTDVQTCVKCVLELCSEISLDPVILVWPLLIGSANCVSKEDRQWARDLFETFKGDHCQDLVVAEELLFEQWARLDAGDKFTPWHKLMKETGKQVLLL